MRPNKFIFPANRVKNFPFLLLHQEKGGFFLKKAPNTTQLFTHEGFQMRLILP